MAQVSMIPDPCRVVEAVPHNARDVHFVVEVPDRPFAPEPGQFVMVSLPGIGEAPFCLAALPGEGTAEGTFELLIRRIGRLTTLLTRLRPGEVMYVRGPYGRRLEWEQFEGSSLILLAGGLGLAPLRAFMRRALLRRDALRRIDLLVGARSPEELLFRDDLATWKVRRDDVHVRLIVDAAREGWGGRIGVITTLLDNFEADVEATHAFLCGPPVMYRHCLRRLLAMGLYESHLWLTLERRMRCGIGLCGNCQMSGHYVCQEGPLFSYREVRHLKEAV
jgi:sulfhydrogenase subunit gamma (sulfur reductase)